MPKASKYSNCSPKISSTLNSKSSDNSILSNQNLTPASVSSMHISTGKLTGTEF